MNTNTNMSKTIVVLTVLLALAASGHAKLNVVSTTADFGSIAQEIGGDLVHVIVLAKPTEDPHFVDAKPSYIAKIARADVLIEGGAELEMGWLPPLIDGARNSKIELGRPGRVLCAEGLALLEVPTTLDRSEGDIHAMGNPHFMTDPMNARHAAERICAALSIVDLDHSAAYRQNLDAFVKRLDGRLASWQKQMAPFQGKSVVAYHNSWPYFANRFGVKIDIFLEPKPGIPPTPAHLADVITHMKAEQIGVILVEPYQNRKTADKVSAQTDAVIVDFAQYPGGVKGSEAGYVELIDYLVNTLATALNRAQTSKE
ncbi:MAG: metal ABC transporter substrate-binding protein [Kiritimatiellae bacterium]|nr:metal ABC transporter substrate-binding protein [Kiritimatiellia bacterium]